MATNELAAILARRRAKAGGESIPEAFAIDCGTSVASEVVSPAAKSSIAERIARLKQQSANIGENKASIPRNIGPVVSPEPSYHVEASSRSNTDGNLTSSGLKPVEQAIVAGVQETTGVRRASSKIQQLQGNLGINVNPFGRPGGLGASGGTQKPSSSQRESIMTTGEEQYGHVPHAMGVTMPGMMGSAVPMPGLTKGQFRLPGMATEGEQRTETSLDNSHATMNRIAGPARRGPTRVPPGAFRIPTMATPNRDTTEPIQAPAIDPAVVGTTEAPAEQLEPKASVPPAVVSPPAPVGANSFSAPSAERAIHSVSEYVPLPTPASAFTPTPVSVAAATTTMQKLPEPKLVAPMKPYELRDDPFVPVYDTPAGQSSYASIGLPDALLANFSMDELVLEEKQSKPKATTTSSMSLSGAYNTTVLRPHPCSPPPASQVETPVPIQAQEIATPAVAGKLAPSPTRAPAPSPVVLAAYTPAPAFTPAPVFAPTPSPLEAASASSAPAPVVLSARTCSSPVSASTSPFVPPPTPTPAKAAVTPSPAPSSGSCLFGDAAPPASDDEDSSESDWSDDDDGTDGQSLFGAQSTGSSKPEAVAPAPHLVTPVQPTPELHQSPKPISSSLFEDEPCVQAPAPAVPAPGFVQAPTLQTTIPPAPYSSLFGGVASSSSESDSDDEGGLFGSGMKR